MPKITIEPTNRGLFQSTGSVVVATGKDLQTLTGNDQTIDTTGFYVPVDPDAARTGTILEAGTADGQLLLLLNKGTSGQNIDFATAGTSNITGANGTNRTLGPGLAILCVWDATNSKWSLTSQTLS